MMLEIKSKTCRGVMTSIHAASDLRFKYNINFIEHFIFQLDKEVYSFALSYKMDMMLLQDSIII